MKGRRRTRTAALAAAAAAAALGLSAAAWWVLGPGSEEGGPPSDGAPAAGEGGVGHDSAPGADVERTGPLSGDVRVEFPEPGAAVASPLVVAGEAPGAWHFEADFPLRLVADGGRTVADSFARALGDWMTTDLVAFRGALRFGAGRTGRATLVLERANASGRPEHDARVRVPVRLAGPEAPRVYFPNSVVDPEGLDCGSVHPVVRRAEAATPDGEGPVATEAAARRLTEELLAGPRPAERQAGYHTTLPDAAGLRGVELRDGVLTVDFDAGLERGMGGSCRVQAARAQIDSTLGRLPGVRRVVVSVEGREEGILQP